MQVDEYMAEVRSIHLELARLSERCEKLLGDGKPEDCGATHAAALVQRQKHLHVRLTQLDALVLHGD